MSEQRKDKRLIKEEDVKIIRILAKDLRGDKTVYAGLTRVKGISWAFCNAMCIKLKIEKNKFIQDLTPEEIERITEFVKNPTIPNFMKNRQKDVDSGEDKHLSGVDLDLQKEFDIKKMRKVKSYKGIRHGLKLPLRGQRTKSNFRKNRAKSGATVRKKK